MPGERKLCHLHGLFVDRSSDERIHLTVPHSLHRCFQGAAGVLPAQLRRLSEGDIDIFLPAVHHIDLAFLQPVARADGVKFKITFDDILVIRDYFGRAIYHRCTVLQQPLISEGLEDNLQPDSVDVSYTYANLNCFHT